ncbi:hypothetical protein ABEB36_006583 [Hypothenemus hampei]|uniref:Aminomethyltransferase n=1 Tax=Hypothenemus hampei TaxID=57062 RepID=A0ABD1EQZ9_HYPHA
MFSLRNVLPNTRCLIRAYSLQVETTSLYNFHLKNKGKIVNFGGFLLPVQYNDQSIVNSHVFTRKNASIFDVSHMLQTEIRGKHCIEFIESLCTADIQSLKNGNGTLTIFTNETGGILDDLIVTKIDEETLYIVSNAAMKQQDQQIMMHGLNNYKKHHNPNAKIEINFLEPRERALVALQGPKAAQALQKLTETDLSSLYFMNSIESVVGNVKNCRITRCGYTGEDGFELSIPAAKAENIVEMLLENVNVKLAGLGARDSLRLEAGLCLYGSDINSTTTPVEAALTWLVAKRRRTEVNFPGAPEILKQIKQGSQIKRIGLTLDSGPPARHGAQILSEDGESLGEVTSGCPSPSLNNKNIAMGYVKTDFSKIGTKVNLKIREKLYKGAVVKMPFVQTNYYVKQKV